MLATSTLTTIAGVIVGACDAGGDTTSSSSGQGGINLGSGGGGGLDPDAACAKFEEQAVSKPVNLYVVFDKSSSMAGNKWDSAKAGMTTFVDDPNSAGISVALRFFPRDPDNDPVCSLDAYKEPTVPYGPLPQNGMAIKDAMAAEAPDGFYTPIYPALGGALTKGVEMASNNPGTNSAVLLVTDGQSEGSCNNDINAITALVDNAQNFNPPVKTFVVGLPGVDQASANLIAQAGGTDSAILVSTSNVAGEFAAALLKVRGDAIPCEYEIPSLVLDGEVAIGYVNIEITPGDGSEKYLVPYDPDCSGEGWRYDDPQNPTAIILCPATCDAVRADFNASIRILLGCETFVN